MNLQDLTFYLSNPFAMTIAVEKDTPIKMELNEGTLVISGGQDITTKEEEFSITDQGTLRSIVSPSELVIVFNNIPFIFRKNSQSRYDLSSAEIETRNYNFHYGDVLPQLYILAELNDRHEVLAFINSTPGVSQRRFEIQPPVHNIGYSANIPSTLIMGPGSVTQRGVIEYIRSRSRNPALSYENIDRLIGIYFREAAFEGVNPDIAIAQMLYWTDSLRNQERVRSNNYGGLSEVDVSWNGRFPYKMSDGRTEGVMAHIQHLKFYASPVLKNPQTQIVDPRYSMLGNIRGSIQTFEGRLFFEIWSPSNYVSYRNSINSILAELYRFSASNP